MPTVNKTLGARFKIEGEEEYKNVIAQLSAGSKTLATEMTLLKAEYKGNTDSVEFLTEKSELLSRTLDQQREKTAATKAMHEAASKAFAEAAQKLAEAEGKSAEEVAAAKEAYAAADRELQKYAQQLNLAQAKEFDLQHQIEDTNQEIENQNNIMAKISNSITGVTDKLGIQLPAGAQKALNSMKSFSNGSVAAIGLVAAAVTAVAAGVKALYENSLHYAAEMDDVISKSAVTGLSTTLIQELQYAEPLIDVSVDTIAGSLTKLTSNMAAAIGGNDKLAASFAALGISIDDGTGHLRDSEDVFFEIVDALGRMGNDTERDAAAMELLGKSAQELNPLIKQGTATLQEYMAAADENYVLTEEQVAALGELDDSYQTLHLTVAGLKKQLAAEFAPAAKDAMDLFTDVVKKAGEMLERSGLVENLAIIIQSLIDILRAAGSILEGIPGFDKGLNLLKVTLGAIAQFCALIADVADVIAGMLTLDFSRIGTAMGFGKSSGSPSHWQTVYMMQSGTYDQYAEYYANKRGDSTYTGLKYDTKTGQYYDEKTGNYVTRPGQNAGGSDSWRGGLTWVGEAGPELVALPAGASIYTAQDSRQLGGDTFNFAINVEDLEDLQALILWARSVRVTARMR